MRVFLSEFALTGSCVEAVELSNSYIDMHSSSREIKPIIEGIPVSEGREREREKRERAMQSIALTLTLTQKP